MDDLAAGLRMALAGRYTIERELGRGGMAVVFLAHDLKLHRPIALKVLRPELAAALGAERFIREIQVAARLQHTNILPLYDSGEAGGFLYYSMPYVEGESLRDRLEREGQSPMADAIQIAREVADALSYAHSHDVVHRDIKPENVLLSGGHALVADFGIARAITAAGGERLTETGIAVGTPAYMSPEQASGASRTDGRADVYGLGCVVYEMLSGGPPFTAPSPQAVLARHTLDPVPPLRTVRQAVPAGVERAVMKALEKVPADRFATALQFAEALEAGATTVAAPALPRAGRAVRLLAISAGLVLLVGAGWIAWKRFRPVAPSPATSDSPRPIAVMPFRNLGDSSDAYFAEGMTEELNNALVRIQGLAVRPRTTVFAEAAKGGDLGELGRRLKAAYVIDGTVRRAGRRVRVNVELVQVEAGATTWSHPYDAGNADVFAIQESIAAQVATALSLQLTATVRTALARRGTKDTAAYDLYLQAKHFTNLVTLEGAQRGVALAQAAIARDSSFANAWVTLGEAYEFLAQFSGEPQADIRVRWRRAVDRAIALDSLNGEPYRGRAILRFGVDWDYGGASSDFRRAIMLSPGSADAFTAYAQFLNMAGRDDSALVVMRHAVELDPTSAFIVMNYATRLWLVGRLDEAIAEARRALALDSTMWVAHLTLADVARDQGRFADAALEAEQAHRIAGDLPFVLGPLARAYGAAGRRAEAESTVAKLTALARHQYVEGVFLAWARLGVNDRPGALDALEESARNRDIDLIGFLTFGGTFKVLLGEPRYQALLRRVGLAQFRTRRFPR
jgi:eukaryotic-like serine/threonine-protein kinase